MERTAWAMPQTIVQKFTADEYVSVCWGVACSVDFANAWEQDHKNTNGISHDPAGCGLPSNQVIIDSDKNGIADKMIELKTDMDDLDCILYTNDKYNAKRDISTVQRGEYIYWTTSAADGRTWHHQGKVEQYESNKS